MEHDEAIHARALKARPLWRTNRARALELDHHMCRLCTFKLGLEVHRILPRAAGGSDGIANLITLCPNHHALAHKNLITEQEFAVALARRRSTSSSRMADTMELVEHVARSFASIDTENPRELGELVGRLTIELPENAGHAIWPEVRQRQSRFSFSDASRRRAVKCNRAIQRIKDWARPDAVAGDSRDLRDIGSAVLPSSESPA